MGVDATMYAGQRVQEFLPSWGGMFTPLELMSPPLESAPLPLESAALETAQPSSAGAPLEVVVSGVRKHLVLGVCEICAIFHGP